MSNCNIYKYLFGLYLINSFIVAIISSVIISDKEFINGVTLSYSYIYNLIGYLIFGVLFFWINYAIKIPKYMLLLIPSIVILIYFLIFIFTKLDFQNNHHLITILIFIITQILIYKIILRIYIVHKK